MRMLAVIVAVACGCVAPAHGDWYHWVACGATDVGDSIRVSVAVMGGTEFASERVVVSAQLLGSCEAAAVVTPAPLPIAAADTMQSFSFTIRPPEPNRIYFYQAQLQDSNGGLTPAPSWVFYANGSYTSCGEGIVTRGTLTYWPCPVLGEVCIRVCPEQCWADCGTDYLITADRASWEAYIGTNQVLDFYGQKTGPWTLYTMPGTHCMYVTRIVPAADPDACVEVATEETSWGDLKAMYR